MVGNPFSGFPRSESEWFNTAAFAIPAQYTFGNSYRGEIQGQRLINFDTSVIRSFPLWRETPFQFRAEAFNLFNHPVFGLDEYNSTDINSPSTFGSVDGQLANTPIENCKLAARLFSKKHKRTARPRPLRVGRVFYRKEDQEERRARCVQRRSKPAERVKA